ncbi:MAG: hypothetical protein JXQ81_05120 [Desulfuromonadales bacterium]|nr:hypothetical protein [Desulfuromonadales bacterium]MBN2791871.1 hypothetical protein [Desulfuromonadales bacterium]
MSILKINNHRSFILILIILGVLALGASFFSRQSRGVSGLTSNGDQDVAQTQLPPIDLLAHGQTEIALFALG